MALPSTYVVKLAGSQHATNQRKSNIEAKKKEVSRGSSMRRITCTTTSTYETITEHLPHEKPATELVMQSHAKPTPTPPAKKAPAKKNPAKKAPVKKNPTKKNPAKKTPTKKAPVKKTPAKKAPAKKNPAKKAPVKKNPTKKNPAKKTPTKKAPVKKTPAKKKRARTPSMTAKTKGPSGKRARNSSNRR